ncbi:calreticulin/calnexin [Schizosaccharomyces cryophilus OY26]|uniref:Calreticulin/calnexin n=1 Tax=Schizosaccharomyces cryophilus (strain OY26 / ATCC MYA-4695 / CBS 11777 / NBRC 106824 / NRRL Y48691) TaxID=653667 RepID=S9W7B9_SCHCR|nr:calreticulin/calnexin [Schizosaccharomyces cryophilus OY26]EPY53800.1 calreticulin/calnexin [Schizosaccharomyces cryophilus OY26]
MDIIHLFFIVGIVCFHPISLALATRLNAKTYKPCAVPAVFAEQFTKEDLESWKDRWFSPSGNRVGSFNLVEAPNKHLVNEYGLITTAPKEQHVIFSNFDVPITRETPFIPIALSFQVKPTVRWDCGHANIKVASQDYRPFEYRKAIPPLIEFGVKKCGLYDYVYFSFGSYDHQSIYHLINPPRSELTEDVTNMYTLLLRDSTYTIRRNKQIIAHGDVQKSFTESPTKRSSFQHETYNAEGVANETSYYTPSNVFRRLLLQNEPYPLSAKGIELDVWSEVPGIFVNNIFFGFSESDVMLFENETFDLKNLLESSQVSNSVESDDGIVRMLLKLTITNLKNACSYIYDATYVSVYDYFYDIWITEGRVLPKEAWKYTFHAISILCVIFCPILYWMFKL